MKNITVFQGVAGSGKTFQALQYCLNNKDKSGLFLTFNRKLKEDCQKKIIQLNIKNLIVKTIHGFIYTDIFGKNFQFHDNLLIKESFEVSWPVFKFEFIIFDEFQDFSQLYFSFSQKLIWHCNFPEILINGDFRQSIYQFNGSEDIYLLKTQQFFKNEIEKDIYQIKIIEEIKSRRITPQIAEFININYQKQIIKSEKSDDESKNQSKIESVELIYGNFAKIVEKILQILQKNENAIVLCSALRCRSGKKLREQLESAGFGQKIKTIHSVKGSEFETVIFFEFSEKYLILKQITRVNEEKDLNLFYVACSRAKKKLFVCWEEKYQIFPKLQCFDALSLFGVFSSDYVLPKYYSLFDLEPFCNSTFKIKHQFYLQLSSFSIHEIFCNKEVIQAQFAALYNIQVFLQVKKQEIIYFQYLNCYLQLPKFIQIYYHSKLYGILVYCQNKQSIKLLSFFSQFFSQDKIFFWFDDQVFCFEGANFQFNLDSFNNAANFQQNIKNGEINDKISDKIQNYSQTKDKLREILLQLLQNQSVFVFDEGDKTFYVTEIIENQIQFVQKEKLPRKSIAVSKDQGDIFQRKRNLLENLQKKTGNQLIIANNLNTFCAILDIEGVENLNKKQIKFIQ